MGSCWFSLLLPTSCAPQPPRRSSVSSRPSRRALLSTTVHALDWPIQGTPAAVAALLPSTRGGHWVTSSPAFSLTVPAHFRSHSGQPCVPAPSLRVGGVQAFVWQLVSFVTACIPSWETPALLGIFQRCAGITVPFSVGNVCGF